ncbi:MAG: TrbG/VirB9 family P-type conjugative transfer protein [Francisellaceae bacterium]
MKKNIAIAMMTTTLLLTGCASTAYERDIASGKLVAAQPAQNVETKIIKEYVPVPMPGQLKPVPNSQTQKLLAKPELDKEAAVKAANAEAVVYPQSGDFFNAMMTYDYMPGAMYTIYTAPLSITDIMLEPGEKIISQAAGDTLRWQIASTYSGEGKTLRWHILVKPQKSDLTNTVIVTTNKRTYHLILKSVDSDSYMVSVKWRYPSDMVQAFAGANLSGMNADGSSDTIKPPANPQGDDLNIDLSQMKFDYSWKMLKGATPAWYPMQIFSAGHQTYIKFPHEVIAQNSSMPVPFIRTDSGDYGTANFNWRMQGDYMVIDTVIKQAYLKTGNSQTGETVVEISKQ